VQAVGIRNVNHRSTTSLTGSLAPAEYGYYFVILYIVLGGPLGLILLGGIGAGFLLIPVAALCVNSLGAAVVNVLRAAWIPIACGVTHMLIQFIIHEESFTRMYVYEFGPWVISLAIVQALAMYHPNFLHRFAMFTFFMGLAMLPFMTSGGDRVGLEHGVGYSNPNAMAAWFGFCVLYLIIRGYVESYPMHRMALWSMAVVSLFVVTLTVSRGALIAIVASLLLTSKRLLKAGIFPLLLLAVLLLVFMEMGIFDQAIQSFTRRGTQDSGRLEVWPLLIDKFLGSPLIGYGASNAGAVTRDGLFRTPHNSFLLFAVASGIFPLALFCAYCLQSVRDALRAADKDCIFYLPLVIYTILITSAGNMDFMTPWAVVSLAMPIAAKFSEAKHD
jgi:O-antigen ligase